MGRSPLDNALRIIIVSHPSSYCLLARANVKDVIRNPACESVHDNHSRPRPKHVRKVFTPLRFASCWPPLWRSTTQFTLSHIAYVYSLFLHVDRAVELKLPLGATNIRNYVQPHHHSLRIRSCAGEDLCLTAKTQVSTGYEPMGLVRRVTRARTAPSLCTSSHLRTAGLCRMPRVLPRSRSPSPSTSRTTTIRTCPRRMGSFRVPGRPHGSIRQASAESFLGNLGGQCVPMIYEAPLSCSDALGLEVLDYSDMYRRMNTLGFLTFLPSVCLPRVSKLLCCGSHGSSGLYLNTVTAVEFDMPWCPEHSKFRALTKASGPGRVRYTPRYTTELKISASPKIV